MYLPNSPGECSDSVCDLVSCANRGVCFANRADGYICLCPLGFRGALCEESKSTQVSLRRTPTKKKTHFWVQVSKVLDGCQRLSHKPFKAITDQISAIWRKIGGDEDYYVLYRGRGIDCMEDNLPRNITFQFLFLLPVSLLSIFFLSHQLLLPPPLHS